MALFVKERAAAAEGSVPAVLGMFESEVRFYREIASVVGVRVPECFLAEITPSGTRIELEDLSSWQAGGDPVSVAELLRGLHDRWESEAAARWPWLRRAGLAADLIGGLYDREWPALAARKSLPAAVHDLGSSLVGKVAAAERAEAAITPYILVHGDASGLNVRTSPDGELAFLDWEDVRLGPGVSDLAWLLVSTVEPGAWDEVIAAYGGATRLRDAMPSAAAQGLLSLADTSPDSESANAWHRRLAAASRYVL